MLSLHQLTIVISNNAAVDIDPNTFKRLDAATQRVDYSNHRGTKVLNSDGTLGSINIVADSIEFLEASRTSGKWSNC